MNLQLSFWDWLFLAWFLLVTTGVGLYYARRAGRNLQEYFLSGRDLPWWALGTSMVATNFAADTPLAVTGIVLQDGIAGNWLWWNFMFGGTLTVFLFSRWWRRSHITTEIELISKRYDGKAASILRGVKAVYLGLLVNSIIFGWVTLAMGRILEVVFDLPRPMSLGILLAITLFYTALSGLWGVVASDVLQFSMAMVGAIILAVLSVQEVGGLEILVKDIQTLGAYYDKDYLAIFPTGWSAFTGAVMVLVLVNWWAVYYPGNEPGGGGYIAQRMFAAKNENHARAGTLWFIFANFVLRPWPWILVALSAAVLEPAFLAGHAQGPYAPEKAYPWMFQVLPEGMLGLVVASFFAAFMSTITTTLNLSASYLVNDLYLPLTAGRKQSDRRQVWVARTAVGLVTGVGCLVAWQMESVSGGWELLMDVTAGTGLVLIARWLWWRVNAWSEISAMLSSALICLWTFSEDGEDLLFRWSREQEALVEPIRLLLILSVTTVVWLTTTFLTPPVSRKHLTAFFEEVRPGGFWGDIDLEAGFPKSRMSRDLILWGTSTMMIFGSLFGLGSALLLQTGAAALFLSLAAAGTLATYYFMRKPEPDWLQ